MKLSEPTSLFLRGTLTHLNAVSGRRIDKNNNQRRQAGNLPVKGSIQTSRNTPLIFALHAGVSTDVYIEACHKSRD